MKKFLVSAVLAVSVFSMVSEAIARPAGGGRSIGRQSQNVQRMPPAAAPQQAPQGAQRQAPAATPNAATPPKPASPWKGILGGALLGLGLGALFSHLGLGGALGGMIGSILMLALLAGVVFFIVRMIRRKSQPQPAPSAFGGNGGYGGNSGGFGGNGGNGGYNDNVKPFTPANTQQQYNATPEIGSGLNQQNPQQNQYQYQPAAVPAHQKWGVPADFDEAAFLRVAKGNFIRLQAAWDKGDTNDIREFTTPEVFAEMRLQLSERTQADYTDVVSLDAELLGIETTATDYLASVRFTGMVKPARDALAEPLNEVWNLSKPVSGSAGWLLAGIQQLA
jgi:predicted lipid-binding transport protein (Tim44 family)